MQMPIAQAPTVEFMRLSGISKSFSKNNVLKDIHFVLNKGEVRALVGENGAGKSTMIRIIAGVSKSDKGEIYLEGRLQSFNSPKDGLDAGIACIYQELDLLPEMTVLENVFLGIEIKTRSGLLDKRAMAAKINAYSIEMGIEVDVNAKVGSLPISSQQIVAIMKAVMHNAKLLIMDEPSSSLTSSELQVLHNQIRKLKQKRVTVIYISHRLEEIFEICDSVTVLRDGHLIATMPIINAGRSEIIELMIGKKVTEERLNARSSFSAAPILEVRNLSYKNTLRCVSFDVKRGELFGILGLLGSGFIELGKILYGIYKPDAGSIHLSGHDISRMRSPSEALSHSIAYVPDERRAYGLFMELDVLTNAIITSVNNFLSFKPLGLVDKPAMEAEFAKYVKHFEIKISDKHQQVQFLSGGNQQKIILARTLIRDTELIVMSCPTKGIDVGSKFDIYRILLECVKQGKTVIVISQEIPELVQICDRILMLKKGKAFREYQGADLSESLIYGDLLS